MLRRKENQLKVYEDPMEKPDYLEADVQAIRAVWAGHGTPEQQKRAIDWLVYAYGTYDTSFRPGGPEADRSTIFAEGRRYAGQILLYMLKYAPSRTSKDKISVRFIGEHKNEQEQAE